MAALVDAGRSFDAQAFFFSYTMDVFGLIAFGVDLKSIELDEPHPFAKAFDRVQALCNDRMPNPLWHLGRALRTSTEREITEGCKVIKAFAAEVIASKRECLERGEELGLDLLSRFIEKKDMNDAEMTDVVLNFMIAGRDTTATGTSWTLYELLQNPRHIQLIRDELQHCLDLKYGGADFTELSHEDKFAVVETGLPYLRAVILEALRMHPPLMKDVKFCVEDDVLPDGTVIKKGQAVLIAPYVLCRNPDVWESPDEFKPDRFAKKVGVSHKLSGSSGDAASSSFHQPVNVSEFDYPTFNAGPRICLGRALALLEMQLMLATILPHFDFAFAHAHDTAYSSSLVSPLKNGLTLTARRR
jgi:cytochrome P450